MRLRGRRWRRLTRGSMRLLFLRLRSASLFLGEPPVGRDVILPATPKPHPSCTSIGRPRALRHGEPSIRHGMIGQVEGIEAYGQVVLVLRVRVDHLGEVRCPVSSYFSVPQAGRLAIPPKEQNPQRFHISRYWWEPSQSGTHNRSFGVQGQLSCCLPESVRKTWVRLSCLAHHELSLMRYHSVHPGVSPDEVSLQVLHEPLYVRCRSASEEGHNHVMPEVAGRNEDRAATPFNVNPPLPSPGHVHHLCWAAPPHEILLRRFSVHVNSVLQRVLVRVAATGVGPADGVDSVADHLLTMDRHRHASESRMFQELRVRLRGCEWFSFVKVVSGPMSGGAH